MGGASEALQSQLCKHTLMAPTSTTESNLRFGVLPKDTSTRVGLLRLCPTSITIMLHATRMCCVGL